MTGDPLVACVLGKSRSGTSLTARVVNLLGVSLGPGERLMPPAADNNPAGFWEHEGIAYVNERILSTLGGPSSPIGHAWRLPPRLDDGWWYDPRLAPEYAAASELLRDSFEGARAWGWKDPRTCLTLPFWRRLVRGPRHVICVRHPLDVAASLEARDSIPREEALALWLLYTSRALLDTRGARRLVVSYESYFGSWERQAERLANFLDLPVPSAAQREAIAGHLDEKLWHHREGPRLGQPLDGEAADLYALLAPLGEPGADPDPRAWAELEDAARRGADAAGRALWADRGGAATAPAERSGKADPASVHLHARYRWAADALGDVSSVLDVGCGTGWGTALLARASRRTTGIDADPGAVAEANRLHAGAATFYRADATSLPFRDGEFDAVVRLETAADEPGEALDELRRVLRPGGLLLVSREIGEALRARLADVAVHRQQRDPASLLYADALREGGDPSRPVDVEALRIGFSSPPAGDEEIAAALDAGRPAMIVEQPDLFGSREASPGFEVSGWARSGAGVAEVIVVVDRTIRIRALHDLVRADLRPLYGDRLGTSGFTARVPADAWPPGAHELTVMAVDRDGIAIGVSGAMQSVPPRPPPKTSPEDGPIEPWPFAAGRDDRFVAAVHRLPSQPPERCARYGWAARAVRGANVLDAGCGDGWGTALLARDAARATGVDSSPQAIEAARHDHGQHATFDHGDLTDLPYDDHSFDAVVCFETITHVRDVDHALDELRRVLTPKGLLLISAPNSLAYPPGNPLHHHRFTPEELRQALQARFANVTTYRQHNYLASLVGDDPEVATAVIEASGHELHTIAIATDGPPPTPTPQLALGPPPHDDEHDLLQAWRERALTGEARLTEARSNARFEHDAQTSRIERHMATATTLGERIDTAESELAEARAKVDELLGSRSWRLTGPLRAVKQNLPRRAR